MPKVYKYVLILISGILWSGVGILLISLASRWLAELTRQQAVLAVIGGLVLGITIAYFGFSGIALKNIARINRYKNLKVCIWAFQKWSSYILIMVMMTMGIMMRRASFIPKYFLTPMYIGIGSALFLASFQYYLHLVKNGRNKDA